MSEQEKMNLDASAEETSAKPAKETKSAEQKAAKPKKAKAEKDKKPGFGKRLGRFFRELKAELKKVSWPTRKETIQKTGVVICCVIIVGLIVWLFDGLANSVVNALLSLFGG